MKTMAQSNDQLVIDTHGLSKTYNHGRIQALKGLNLQVGRHSIFGFLGPNGAGKSTAIKLLLGLARPTSGTATIFGQDVVRDGTAVRQRVGYLAQDPRFYENLTARETLRFVAGFFYRGPKPAVEHRIEETLDLVGLADKADRSVRGFSGGERQRLGIAQAQVNYPDLLILDEPAASLDPMGRHDVLEVMERLKQHTTIFYSTHILEDVQRVSDSVAILNHGELLAQAPIQELLGRNRGITYSVVFTGELDSVQARLAAQPWVQSVEVLDRNGATHLQVGVNDQQLAAAQLLPLVMAGGANVVEFGQKKADLEEVFVSMVEGDRVHGH